MKHAFDRASVIKTLKDGLTKPNPANPNVPMWTIDDLDSPAPYSQDNYDTRRIALKRSLGENFQESVHMPQHENLLRHRDPDVVEVEIIDPRDLLPPSTDA
tara:strand:+ start:423 stop:725 length:303 start_codon:yes stop_codon:yes gene_type:complete